MNSQDIRHMVIFTLKHPKKSQEAEAFLEDGRTILTSIPSVRNFQVFRQVSVKNDFDYGFSMDFASQEDYDAYNAHPLHVDFVQQRWLVEVERFLEIDFQTR
jgi:hypothetical protein